MGILYSIKIIAYHRPSCWKKARFTPELTSQRGSNEPSSLCRCSLWTCFLYLLWLKRLRNVLKKLPDLKVLRADLFTLAAPDTVRGFSMTTACEYLAISSSVSVHRTTPSYKTWCKIDAKPPEKLRYFGVFDEKKGCVLWHCLSL